MKAVDAYNLATQLKFKKGAKEDVYRAYEEAAEMYLQVGLVKEAKICLVNCKKWHILARICEKQQLVCMICRMLGTGY